MYQSMQIVSLTADEALQKVQTELNQAMMEFDRWVSRNSLSTHQSNVEYRTFQQRIKLLKLRIKELQELRDDFQNTLVILRNTQLNVNPNIPSKFTRSKDARVYNQQNGMKIAQKKNGLVSRGCGNLIRN
jgi:chromosome segregation ATPase